MRAASLRQRNRERTRDELQSAALALFAVHGFAATTVEQIAAAAGVSTRTFFRYFPTKEDAVFDDVGVIVGRLREALRESDPPLPPIQRVRHAILAVQDPGGHPEREVTRARLIAEVPAVRARFYQIAESLEDTIAEFLEDQFGADNDAQARARITAAALFGALRGARRAVSELPDADPTLLVHAAFDLVQNGMSSSDDHVGGTRDR